MKTIQFKVDSKTLPSMTEYITTTTLAPALIVINDGSGYVKLGLSSGLWITKEQTNFLLQLAEEDKPITNNTVIDANTLLKALAIAQDPKLATSLIKD